LKSEVSTLAAVYRFVLDCHAEKKATGQLSAPIRTPPSFDHTVDSLTEEGEGDR